MTDLASRLAGLSPAQRERFEEALRRRLDRAPSIPLATAGPWPASFGQERMWVGDGLAPSVNNYATMVRLSGPLNLPALRAAALHVIERHEVLRTTLSVRGGRLVQEIAEARLPIRIVDLDRPAAVFELMGQEARRPFDLEHGPLLRLLVARLGAGDHCVLLTIHHAVTDGWSNGVLIDELGAGYRDALAGRPWSLAPPPLQYKDFAAWQRSRMAGDEQAELEKFWRTELAELPRTDLAQHLGGAGAYTTSRHLGVGGTVDVPLGRALTERLNQVRRDEGGSRFMLVLAALVAVIRLVTGEDDVLVGTLATGRGRPELERLIGYFINVVPLRFRSTARNFRALWAHVRERTQAAYAHQELPFELLLRLVRQAEGGAVSRPVRVLCVAHDPMPALDLPGLDAQMLDVGLNNAPFDLVVEVREHDGELNLALQHDVALFTTDSVAMLGELLRTVLDKVVDDPDIACDEILIEHAASSTVDLGKTENSVHEVFAAGVKRWPDAVALVDGDRRLSYRTLNAQANRLARQLRADGVRAEDRVGIRLDRSAESVIAMLAILKAGGCFVALDPAHPPAWHEAVMRAAGIRHVVDDVSAVQKDADLRLPVHPNQLAYLIATSGSTGVPKLVAGTHAGLLNRARGADATHPIRPGEICAARTALSFVDSVWETLGPLLRGGTLSIVDADDAIDPVRLIARLAAERVERLVAVPALLTMLLDADDKLAARLPALRTWFTSGEALLPELADRFVSALPDTELFNVYGSAEVAADATILAVPRPAPDQVTIGRAQTGVTTWVGDSPGRAVFPLVPGELRVGGHGLARGYFGRPGMTADRFRPDPLGAPGSRAYRTGDRVQRLAGGQLAYRGRLDAQVQIRGHRVEPADVEQELRRHPRVRDAAVVAETDPTGGLVLAAYVESNASADRLRRWLRDRMPAYLVPSALTVVDTLPRTAVGKLYRLALRSTERSPSTSENHDEAVIAAAFAEVIGVDRVGRDDDFFLIGGHSVLAARLVRELGPRLGVELGLADLFEAPTVAELAARVAPRPRTQADDDPGLVVDRAAWHEPFPLTEVQEAYYVGRGDDVSEGGVSTHAYLELRVADLDLDRFGAALRAVIERHAMLRAVLRPDGTQQVLADVPPYRITVEDAGADAVRAAMSHQVLDPHTWPLFDVRVSREPQPPGDAAIVHVSIDSLICDAYSFGLVMNELTERYRNPACAPPAPDVSFRAYVVREQAKRTTARHAAAVADWDERVLNLPAGPELPADRVASAPAAQRFTRRNGRLPAATWNALKERANAAGLTPSGVLLAAFGEVLTRWSRRPHYTLMLTVYNREPVHPEIGAIVGDFTSLVAFEVDHREPGPFTRRAEAVQRRLWSDLDHGSVSAVTVIRQWALAKGLPPQPISPVVFTSNLPLAGSAAAAPQHQVPLGELGYAITQTPQVHLDHQVSEQDGELLFNWDGVDDRFAPGVLDDMFAAYVSLLDRLAATADAWTAPQLVPLPPAQADRRRAVNDTAAPLPQRCLHEAVADAAARYPDRVAVIDGDVRLDYPTLMARARRIGRTLRALGTRPNTLVGVAARRGWQQVVAALGVLESGAAFLPLDPELPAERLRHLAERGEVDIVLTQAALRDTFAFAADVQIIAVDDDAALDADDRPLTPAQGLTDLAYVIFTSGSTGEPKGVAIDHLAAANTVVCVNERFQVGPHDRVLAVSSLSFDLAVYDIFGLLSAGGAIVLPEHGRRREPGHWAQLVRRERITLWNSVPALAELLVEHADALDPDALTSLRAVLLSGDWIPVSLPDRVHALTGARVTSLGGATEAAIWSVWFPVAEVDPRWPSIPYGVPMASQTLHVLDHDGEPRPDWVAGDLFIGGTGVAREYWRDTEQTARSFAVHPRVGGRLYRTGDIARYLPDGNLEFLGREDSQVKINGYRIELGEIEAALERSADVRAGAVIAAPAARGRRLVAFVVPADSSSATPFDLDRVRRRVAEILPAYAVPAAWTVLDALPLTGNGKVDQSALQRLAAGPAAAPSAPARAASGALVTQLAAVWSEVLGIGEVGPADDFFALGGTSLVAIRLLTRIEQQWGVRIPLSTLFTAPTVSAVAGEIASGDGTPATPRVVAVADPDHRHEPFPLTDIQQAYWLGRRHGGTLGGVATHSYFELDVADLDVARLERALDGLVRRHAALRTVVRADGQQQVLAEVPPMIVPTLDLRGRPSASDELERLRAELSHEVRDVSRWPLFELHAVHLDGGRTRLCITFDLLMVDGRSVQLLTTELLARYAEPGLAWPDLDITFRDYVTAVARLRSGEDYQRDRAYWRERLATLPPAPARPVVERADDGAAFTRLNTEVDATTWRELREWAGAAGVTPSALVCAAFATVLTAYSDSPRFTLNLTTFHRLPVHPDVDALIGDFTATTLLEVEPSGGQFLDHARQIQHRMWQDLEHRLVSGIEVQRMLRRAPDRPAEDAMMPVVFTSTLFPDDAMGPPRAVWSATPVYAISQTPQVLLDHQATENEGRLICNWDFVADAFPPGFMDSMFAGFERILAALAQQARTAVRESGGASR
jgi:nonribosomal peptide synthetase protein BlmIV